MLRDARVRDRTAGAAPSLEEESGFMAMTASLARGRKRAAAQGSAAEVKKRKRTKIIPHLATKDLGLAIHNGLAHGCNPDGLNRWIPHDPDRLFNEEMETGEKEAPLYVAICDELILQPSLFNFLSNKKRGQFWLRMPPIHRRHNDFTRGLAIGGAMGTWISEVFIVNVAYGPSHAQAFFSELEDLGHDLMVLMTPDDETLDCYWQDICDEKGWLTIDQRGPEQRERYLSSIAQERPFRIKGDKASLARWYNAVSAVKQGDSTATTKKMGLALLSKRKGWIDTIDDLFRGDDTDPLPSAIVQHQPAAAGPAGSADAQPAVPKARLGAFARGSKGKGKSVSVAATKSAAQADLSSIIRSSVNSLHAVARLMHQPERRPTVRLILDLSETTMDEHNWNLEIAKTAQGSIDYYIAMANGEWLEALREIFRRLKDATVCRRAGMTVFLSPAELAELSMKHPQTVFENGVALKAWRLATSLVSERASSMMRHTTYPNAMAPAASPDKESSDASLKRFEETWDSYVWARQYTGYPTMALVVKEHSFNSRHMEDTARIFRKGGYTRTPEVLDRIEHYFGGWGTEKMFEDVNRECRLKENSGYGGNSVKGISIFKQCFNSELIEQYDRKEIRMLELPADTTVKSPEELGPMFRHSTEQDGDTTTARKPLDLSGIMQEPDWFVWTGQSIKRQAVCDSLVRFLKRLNKPAMVEATWHSTFVPTRQYILQQKTLAHPAWVMFSLYVCQYGVIGWPVKRLGHNGISIDLDAPELVVKHIHDFTKLFVLDVDVHCPIGASLLSPAFQGLGVVTTHGPSVPIVDWQVSRGFAGVPEMALRKLMGVKKIDNALEAVGLGVEDKCALTLMRHCKPDLTQREATKALLNRAKGDSGVEDDGGLSTVPERMLDDVIKGSDRATLRTHVDDRRKLREKREKMAKLLKVIVPKFFKTVGAAASKPIAPIKTKAAADRWWSSMVGDDSYIQVWKPSVSTCYSCNANGQFKVVYPDVAPKSFAWTKRGMEAASVLALRFFFVGGAPPCYGRGVPDPPVV